MNEQHVPGDLEKLVPWFNVIRRARQVSGDGAPGIVTMRVVVDGSGNPIEPWSCPDFVRLEPKRSVVDGMATILEMLAGGDNGTC
jgi:hypothetical protein